MDLDINGKIYSTPIANNARKTDLYFVKKALKGDEEALEILLGGAFERFIYIGDVSPLWIKVTREKIEVV